MAGAGSRFFDVGYALPKYKIPVNGKTLFEWSMLSLVDFFDDHFIFSCLKGADIDWIKETAKGLGISSCSFHVRDNLSKGQAETVYDSVKTLSEIDRDVLWIYNIDTYVKSGIRKNDMLNSDGCLHVYHSTLPNLSFVDYDASGSVSNVVEKSPISTWASVGSYGFSSVGLYKKIYEEAYFNQKAKVVYGEQYIAPMYKVMLDLGMDVAAPKLQDELVHILGTPEDLDRFKSVF